MAIKLNNMKQEMMENEHLYGMRRKFGAVRTSGDRLCACTVSVRLLNHELIDRNNKCEGF